MMTGNKSAPGSGRRKLLLLLLLFAAPVLGSYALYFWAPKDWQPEGRTNQGHLLTPAKTVETLSLHDVAGQSVDQGLFTGKWTLLLVGPSACEATCEQVLYDTRQVRTALGKNTLRVQRVFVATDRGRVDELQGRFKGEHPDLKLLVAEGAEVYAIDRQFTVDSRSPLNNAYDIYLLDPNGNWLMYYTPQDPAKDLLKDLKKLLRLSNIG
jgi:cytochrome oxidase Cu insertion factor (SCO1/SenC/PrrC family)